MEMPQIPEAAKKYWPYVVGGAIGLFLVYKVAGSKSSGSTVSVSSGFDPQQAQYALQVNSQNLAAQQADTAMRVQFLAVQSQAAKNVSEGAAQVIEALQKPTVTAINAAAAENVATVTSAGAMTAASYAARADIIQAAMLASGMQSQAITNAVSTTGNSFVASQNSINSQFGSIAGAGGAAASAGASSDAAMWSTIGTIAMLLI